MRICRRQPGVERGVSWGAGRVPLRAVVGTTREHEKGVKNVPPLSGGSTTCTGSRWRRMRKPGRTGALWSRGEPSRRVTATGNRQLEMNFDFQLKLSARQAKKDLPQRKEETNRKHDAVCNGGQQVCDGRRGYFGFNAFWCAVFCAGGCPRGAEVRTRAQSPTSLLTPPSPPQSTARRR